MVIKKVEFRLGLQNNEFIDVNKLSFSCELTNRVAQQSVRCMGFEVGDLDLDSMPPFTGYMTLGKLRNFFELEVLHP